MIYAKNGVNQDFLYFVSIDNICSVVKFEHVQTIPHLSRAPQGGGGGVIFAKNGVNQDFLYFVSIDEIWSVMKF